jgi:adenine-specific DNA-methyltransferase
MPKKIVAAKKNATSKKVESIRHKDKRANIPTEELRDFVVEDELAPKTMLYPRDPSLDPQLVWKGKDEQDREDLAVPVVPIYIQEKIHPQAIIDALPRMEQQADGQTNLFADFNGGPKNFEQKVDFYHYQQNWSNRMVLGDSLLVMTSLAEKEGLKGKVQTIYLDPPYGIKFGSNWQVSTRKRDVKDGKAEDATRQPEQVRAFRDTWKLGIHSYLAYLRDRLVVARELLTETGSVFVQIGDENVHLVRCLLDEVFGSQNFVSQIIYRRGGFQTGNEIANTFDYILWCAKSKEQIKLRPVFNPVQITEWYENSDHWIEDESGNRQSFSNEVPVPSGYRLHSDRTCFSATGGDSSSFKVKIEGKLVGPAVGRGWSTNETGVNRLIAANRLMLKGQRPRFKPYYSDFPFQRITNGWMDTVRGGFSGAGEDEKLYVVQTGVKIIERCIMMTTDPSDLVLDPTCGSGTTAYVAEQWGRRWITCDTSRVALALARTRLMGAKYPYYLLADSPEGIKKESELTGKMPPEYKTEDDIRKGFVYKRVPHVTLKSIANNPDIQEGMTREQIDAAIARHAETETLYDQPYEDNKRVRVCGPFSVESLSPHRVLSTDENENGTASEQEGRKQQDFATMILDNLKKAGVQNTVKNERLTFDRLDAYAGVWLNAAGEYTDADSKTKRVAVTLGPEHGTVGPQQVKEAAKEAVQGVGFDLLVVCGFAFDPHVAEEVKRYGKLTVLPTKMNPDLAMGDELLKKTGAGNLFMVFGEPDVDINKQKNGQIVVEIKGVDVYDPTTGQIRSSSTDDIACWFIDTDYNGESFFVRHAYFTGAEEPYEKLKRALRADIDEAAWSSLYSTVSRPFDKPTTGKIAVKVINHYGDEVLKVFEV